MKYNTLVEQCIAGLKDFQQLTVEYVVGQFSKGQKKFLIADEVGLGKTIVAKGIIASLYQQQYSAHKDFRVIYICSNQALAKQNLSKLNFITSEGNNVIEYNDEDDRLTSLAYEPKSLNSQYGLRIKALTPATSFDNKTKSGKADERVLLFRLLMYAKGMEYRQTSLKWFLKGGKRISENNWNWKIENAVQFEAGRASSEETRTIRKEIYTNFNKSLNKRLSDKNQKAIFGDVKDNRSILNGLHQILEERKQHRSFQGGRDEVFRSYYSLISELRLQLAYLCKAYLKADLFILDEFQRFSQLIKQDATDNKGEEIARAVFSDASARVLLLSATPFKAYTNYFDEHNGENHYKEFKSVLQFLCPHEQAPFWENLEKSNQLFFEGIKNINQSDRIELISLKNKLESTYRQCMVRTERNLVEKNETIRSNDLLNYLDIQPVDINDFIAIDEIILESNRNNADKLAHPVEYVKSAPFPLSFLQDYDHHNVLRKNYAENIQLQKLIKKSKKAFVPVERINAYKALLPERSINEPNPKLRFLYNETIRNNGYKLLWIPSSLKYYEPKGGPFFNTDNFSKTLIFSAWKMVPRMVSALVSYEAERLSIGKLFEQEQVSSKYSYKDKKRYPAPLLTFRKGESGPSGMNNLMLAYPSPFLSEIYNPSNNLVAGKDLSKIRIELKNKIISNLKSAGIFSLGIKGGSIQKWDWLALLLLDRQTEKLSVLKSWLQTNDSNYFFESENETDNKESDTHKSAKQIHFDELKKFVLSGVLPDVGRVNESQLNKIAEHIVELCIGGPGVCAFRSINQMFKSADFVEKMTSAFDIGMGMISMFNKPESIAIVKVAEDETFYYQNVLSYAVDGNIQAMLDEFVYQLSDSGGISNCREAAELIKNILMVGGSKVDVITEQSIRDDNHFSMRTHYAVPFGSSNINDLKNGKRQVKVREAFNSPFRPFVLTTTSIGQEGLDFHFYCRKIIHWNLPNNPIDLEQREGRIKRYKSLLVRKNVADKYKDLLNHEDIQGNLWDAIFEYASKENRLCDLIPYWHLNTDNNQIEALIPMYRYSKDLGKYKHIKHVLTNYRLTFGHPNQQDLLSSLEDIDIDHISKLGEFMINLSPVNFKEKT